MGQVVVNPMSPGIRSIPPHWRPSHPPVFPGCDGEPSAEDCSLALALWRALDLESRRWYTYNGTAREFVGIPLAAADIAGLAADG